MGLFDSFRKAIRTVDLDLQKDAADLYAYIASRAASYNPKSDRELGGDGPIQMAYAGYEFDQSGWFVLVFDRRPDARHDGHWTNHIDDHMIHRPRWVRAATLNEMQLIRVRRVDGSVDNLSAGKVSETLGRMIIELLQRAARDGVFARLPLADDFHMGIEEFNGSFGWDSADDSAGQT